jgi:transcriptional regulator with XRE-family HTH domain/tetratricopeptide (TPR) repeat protein
MVMIRKWTGRESRALREAMRVSQRDFADQLGVTSRAVAKWEAGGTEIVPRLDSQAILDTKLRQVSGEDRSRFEMILGIVPENDDVKSGKGSDNFALILTEPAEIPASSLANEPAADVVEVGKSAEREPVNQLATERPHDETPHQNALISPVPRARPGASLEKEFDSDYSAPDGTNLTVFEPDTIEAVKRRAFLAEMAAAAGMGAAGLPLEAVRHGLNLSAAEERSAADADEWNEIAMEYGESYLTTPPSELLKPLMIDVVGLQSALQRNSTARSHRDLMRVAALLSVFTAQTLMNTGQVHEARRWWRTAKNCADRSDDPDIILWVRAREINRAPEFRPATAVLFLSQEAENYVGHASTGTVLEFLSAKALTLTRAGRLDEAEGVLDQLRKRSTGLVGQSDSLLAWDPARLHGIESFVYSRLGNLEKTESAYKSVLGLRDSGQLLWRAGNGMKLGFCLLRKGDITEGLRYARTVLSNLPREYRTNYMVDDARELLSNVPVSGRQLSAAREYREWLSSL